MTEAELWREVEWSCRKDGEAQRRGLGLCWGVRNLGLGRVPRAKAKRRANRHRPANAGAYWWRITDGGYAARRAFCRRMARLAKAEERGR